MLAVAHREVIGAAADRAPFADTARRWGLPLCVLLALALRLAALFLVGHPEMLRGHLSLSSDEPSFHETAQALATTGRYSRRPDGPPTAFRPPGLILPLAALYYVVRPTPYVGVAYVLLGSLAIVMMVYHVTFATCADRRVALMAALLAAVSPTLVFTASGIWSEPQAIVLTLLLLWWLILGRTDPGSWGLLGLCAAIAYLTRPSAAFLFPVLISAALLSGRGWRRVLNAVVLVSVLTLPIGFWALRNRLTFGDYIVGGAVAGEALWGSNNPVTAGISLPAKQFRDGFDLYAESRENRYLGSWVPMDYIPGWAEAVPAGSSELAVYHHQVESTIAFIKSAPRSWVRLLGYKLARLLTVESYAPSITGDVGVRRIIHRAVTQIEFWFIVAWGFAGVWHLVSSGSRAGYLYLFFAAAGLANVLVTYANPRFLLPLTSILIPPAALAITRALDGWRAVGVQTPRSALA